MYMYAVTTYGFNYLLTSLWASNSTYMPWMMSMAYPPMDSLMWWQAEESRNLFKPRLFSPNILEEGESTLKSIANRELTLLSFRTINRMCLPLHCHPENVPKMASQVQGYLRIMYLGVTRRMIMKWRSLPPSGCSAFLDFPKSQRHMKRNGVVCG